MLFEPDRHHEADRLADKLATATKSSRALFTEIAAPSLRLMTLNAAGKATRLSNLLTSEAWTDAAIELLALDAPSWAIHRLCRDDGEWLCSLTRFPDLPHWLDDSVEGRHRVLALAILAALVELRARSSSEPRRDTGQLAGVAADIADYR